MKHPTLIAEHVRNANCDADADFDAAQISLQKQLELLAKQKAKTIGLGLGDVSARNMIMCVADNEIFVSIKLLTNRKRIEASSEQGIGFLQSVFDTSEKFDTLILHRLWFS